MSEQWTMTGLDEKQALTALKRELDNDQAQQLVARAKQEEHKTFHEGTMSVRRDGGFYTVEAT